MAKKHTWWAVLSEIKEGNISEKKQQELFSLTKSFQQLANSHSLIDCHKNKELAEILLDKMYEMAKKAEKSSYWRVVIRKSEKGSRMWREAILGAYKTTGTLYAWEELKAIVPDGHDLYASIAFKVGTLRKKKRLAQKKD